MRVLLIQPPLLYYTRIIKSPNIGLATIAAVLEEAGVEVQVIEANAEGISLDEIIERIRKIKPDLVGSGGQTPISHLSLEIFERTKKEVNKNIITLAGGPHFPFWKNNHVRPIVIPRQLINLFSRNKFRCYMAQSFFYTTTKIMKTKKFSNY